MIVSGVVAGTVQVQMAISFRSGEEFIVPSFLLGGTVFVTAALLGLTLAVGGGARAIALVAVAIFAVLVLLLVAIESATQPFPPAPSHQDVVVLAEILMPALLAIVIEWWFVRRHLRKAGATPLAA
jgi:purine-cytosine permease-like protein